MVNILVLMKQVFQTADLKVDRSSKTIVTQGVPRVISEVDKNALEEAVRIKEKHGGKITAITLGPPEAKEALREALAMGADEGCLLTDPLFEGSDAHATANVLAAAVTRILQYDLVLCGAYSEDLYAFQVGPRLAEMCNLPQITYAAKLSLENDRVIAERDLENERQVVEAKLPCLVSVVREINEPRLPTLMAIMAASKKPTNIWNAADLALGPEELGFNGSLIEVLRSTVTVGERKRILLQGEAKEIAPKVAKSLVQEGVLKA
ncbi:MAG TPA: electron transfer flavoprotein subunit beta/FixA family protein [Candidatus Acidoferrales bacterium]|nr:electron transfer flavoprotein subunit beta/FixA family protein [Candidatus Acidoferrales bacterium]